ncbi:hypothetical protein [Paracoccus sp. (in: a-proteobacteria)]|uniref:hypothetical protein n=1 Tax=Paracoccus sp. TaxID=267 RepID=UPI00289F922C|nr:hypothetical protein [Paracoccus sp. (in: a-proteobacteria)]
MGSIPITRSKFPGSFPLRGNKRRPAGVIPVEQAERKPMSPRAKQRLSFYLLIGLTLYAAVVGAA